MESQILHDLGCPKVLSPFRAVNRLLLVSVSVSEKNKNKKQKEKKNQNHNWEVTRNVGF